MELYFAYGSNMSSRRLRERVPGARPRGAARLPGMRMVMNKRGRDGSGKANVVEDPGAQVWGVVYELRRGDWPVLDRFEPGYVRRPGQVWAERERLAVHVYVAEPPFVDEGLLAFDWYLAHLVEGAREHALPQEVIAALLAHGRA